MIFDFINIQRNIYCIFDASFVPLRIQRFKGDPNYENQHFTPNENLIKLEHKYTKPNQTGTYIQGESEKKLHILSNLEKKKNSMQADQITKSPPLLISSKYITFS